VGNSFKHIKHVNAAELFPRTLALFVHDPPIIDLTHHGEAFFSQLSDTDKRIVLCDQEQIGELPKSWEEWLEGLFIEVKTFTRLRN